MKPALRRSLYGLLALAALAAALVALAPARLATEPIDRATRGAVALERPEGNLWRGRGVLRGPGIEAPIRWRLGLPQQLELDFEPTSRSRASGHVSASPTMVATEQLHLELAAAELAARFAGRAKIDVTGTIVVDAPRAQWQEAGGFAGTTTLTWRDASLGLAGAPPRTLGDVHVALAGAGGEARGPVSNEGGEIALAGTLAIDRSGGGTLDVLLRPRRADDANLAAILAAFGTPAPGGTHMTWTWRGQ